MKKKIFSLICATPLFMAGVAQAKTVTFDDLNQYFPGYPKTTTDGGVPIDDAYGTPTIKSMTVDWDWGNTNALNKVTINLYSSGIQNFDSLFINTNYIPNADGSFNSSDWSTWNYFVHAGGTDHTSSTYTQGTSPTDGLYQVINERSYQYTFNKSGGRLDHPNGIDNSSLTRVARLGNYDNRVSRSYDESLTITYDFTRLTNKIILGEDFAFAYSPWCANDVILGAYNGDPVPEPATLLLFGSGVVGLAGLRLRRKRA